MFKKHTINMKIKTTLKIVTLSLFIGLVSCKSDDEITIPTETDDEIVIPIETAEFKINTHHSEFGFTDSLSKAIQNQHWDVLYTGSAVVASNGTRYMIKNLFTSLSYEIVLIGFLMAILFRSFKMVIISLIPNFTYSVIIKVELLCSILTSSKDE